MPYTSLDFRGSDWVLHHDEISPEMLDRLRGCGGSGAQDANVAAFRRDFEVVGDEDTCRRYLRGYGAWEDDELQDHDANLSRLVWLTGCALAEDEEAYFCTY